MSSITKYYSIFSHTHHKLYYCYYIHIVVNYSTKHITLTNIHITSTICNSMFTTSITATILLQYSYYCYYCYGTSSSNSSHSTTTTITMRRNTGLLLTLQLLLRCEEIQDYYYSTCTAGPNLLPPRILLLLPPSTTTTTLVLLPMLLQ